jgi:hypothetical protein
MSTSNEEAETVPEFTEDDLDNCWNYHKSYFVDILNGEYDLDKAREDLRGLIGSEFDRRAAREK